MELKKTVLGRYSDKNVDVFISGIRADYEKCLKDQKDRILKLRQENSEMKDELSKYKANLQDVTLALSHIEKQKSALIDSANSEVDNIKKNGNTITRYYKDKIYDLKTRMFEIHNKAIISLEKLIFEVNDIKNSKIEYEDCFDLDADLIAIVDKSSYKPRHLKID